MTALDREERSKIMNEVRPVENTNKNPQSFLKISYVQKELSQHKLQGHVYQLQNLSRWKEDKPETARIES